MKTLFCLVIVTTVACLLWIGMSDFAEASSHYGGECRFCHSNDQPDAMTIIGETDILDDLKVFDVEPGGSVDLGFDVTAPGSPAFHRMVLRGLDRLNGATDVEGTPQYLPLLYTPDPTWQTASSSGVQYLFWEGQFYGQGPSSAAATYSYHLELDLSVAPGLYDLTAYVGGGFPDRSTPGKIPTGGWSHGEDFQLRVVPEPGSVALLTIGSAVFCLGGWWRKRAAAIALVLMAGALTADVAQAYPSRGGDCSICHSFPGPSTLTGDFEILDLAGSPTASYTVAAGEAVTFRFDITDLVEDSQNLGTDRRGYMVLDKLDLLSVDAGPPPAYEDITYTTPKYTPTDLVNWHTGHNADRYFGQNGQYYAQSTTDPSASLLFPLTLGTDVVPGVYNLTAKLSGGRPSDPLYLNGWTTIKDFTLTVTAPLATTVPEPGTFLLLASAVPVAWLYARRRRHGCT